MKVNLMFAEDITEREKVKDKQQGPQDRALGNTFGDKDWMRSKLF